MISWSFLLVLVLLVLSTQGLKTATPHAGPSNTADDGSTKIEHWVVLMLENRAFDHMLGWMSQWGLKVDGLNGTEFNMANNTKYFVKDQCPYVNPFDPLHDVPDVTKEIMGGTEWVDPSPMSGFAQVHLDNKDPEFWTVLHGFSPHLVPAISTLAENFVVFDRWYSGLPGPTYPNRMFWHSGTSHGMTSNDLLSYLPGMPQRTIFDVLNDNDMPWAGYYGDISDTILYSSLRELKNLEKLHPYKNFEEDVNAGNLGTYTWVTPQFFPWFGVAASDQHPDHDVVKGEELIAAVYKILRNSPIWNKTALVVTYDEHGGFYDHVGPPMKNIPNPDGIVAKDGFNFTRLGVRVPTIIASPWVSKGQVVSEPPAAHYEHSSFYATFRKMHALQEQLTNRTAWAATFEHIFSLATPRTDCPTSLPTPSDNPERAEAVLQDQQQRPPNGLQKELFTMVETAVGANPVTEGRGIPTQLEMAKKIRAMHDEFISGGKAAGKSN